MRLTLALMKRRAVPGFIWTGKHRLGHHCYPENMERFVKRLQIEDRNMFLLRHPYLSKEQEQGHAKALDKPTKFINSRNLDRAAKHVVKSTRFEDKFKQLCVSEKWEHGAC